MRADPGATGLDEGRRAPLSVRAVPGAPASRIQELGNYANLDIPALVGEGRLPPDFLESDDPERLIPTFVRPEWTGIVIAGGTDSIFQRGFMNNHEHGPPTTRRIELL